MQRRPTLPWLVSLLATALSACQSAPPRRPDPAATLSIYIVKRSWHIDIGFAAVQLQPPLATLLGEFPSASFVEFGFGDRHYLVSRDHGPGSMLAALWPGAGLILMTALGATPQEAFGADNVVLIRVTAQQLRDVQGFIWKSLADSNPVANGPYEGSVFFAAVPRYSAFHTCNTWAAEALHAAPLPVHSTGVELSGQVWSQVKQLASPGANVNQP